MNAIMVIGNSVLLAALALPVSAVAQDPESKAQVRMKAMDMDLSGSVSLAEFTEFRRGWTSKRNDAGIQMKPDVVQRAFDKLDNNSDGQISFAELLKDMKNTQSRK